MPASARDAASADQIRAEIRALRMETDRRIEELRAETDLKIARLLAVIEGTPAREHAVAEQATTLAGEIPADASDEPVEALAGTDTVKRLALSGDVRLRYEENFAGARAKRGRGVVRGRLAARYEIDDRFSVDGRLVTGNEDDPNTADVTLGSFADDLTVSLDQLYAHARFGPLELIGGKFANPFARTDLVWDGDFNPQGLSASVTLPLGAHGRVRATGLHMFVEENAGGRDSALDGGQIAAAWDDAPLRGEIAAGYYAYVLGSLASADEGDFRSNLRRPDGAYLSDFHLLDLMGSVTFAGLGEGLPIAIVGDYVKNLGAAVKDGDSGYSIDLFIGRADRAGAWRVQAGHAVAGVDAVFAAFSHDNIDLATNYVLDTLALDYALSRSIVLNATYYHYRLKDRAYPGALLPGHWANRVRLNMMYSF